MRFCGTFGPLVRDRPVERRRRAPAQRAFTPCDDAPVTNPADALQRLRDAAESGELDAFCTCHGVRVLTVFGSAARGEERARDLDVGIVTERGWRSTWWRRSRISWR
jgi:hypothetical protein